MILGSAPPSPQTAEEQSRAKARLQPFGGRIAFYLAAAAAAGVLLFAGLMVATAFILTARPDIVAISVDFRIFWAAAKLAFAGQPLAVNDLARLGEAHATNLTEFMPWLYPPGFLVVVTPLGALSYAMAFAVWTALSLLAVGLAVRPFTAGKGPLWTLMTFAPASLPCLMLGQNSLFWMAGLLAALATLRDGKWVLAGVFFGVLTLKPQLGVMIPVALLAIGAWRTILVAGVTAVLLLVLPTLAYGVDYWAQLSVNLAEQAERLAFNVAEIQLMVSPAFTLTFFGVQGTLAWALQWGIAGAALVVVFVLWRSDRVEFDTKLAGLLCAMLLSAPYLWYYEGALLAPIALFLLRGGVLGLRPLHVLLLGPLWIGTGMQALNTFLEVVDQRWLGAAYLPPVLLVCLGLCLRQIWRPDLAAASSRAKARTTT